MRLEPLAAADYTNRMVVESTWPTPYLRWVLLDLRQRPVGIASVPYEWWTAIYVCFHASQWSVLLRLNTQTTKPPRHTHPESSATRLGSATYGWTLTRTRVAVAEQWVRHAIAFYDQGPITGPP